MSRIHLFPASFDPITIGHLDIIRRAAAQCDKLVVLVAINPTKQSKLTPEQRYQLVAKTIADAGLANVEVITSTDLTINVFKQTGASCIVRGVRNYQDFEYEVDLASINASLGAQQGLEIETLYLVAKAELKHVSSSLVRQLATNPEWFNQHAAPYVPKVIYDELVKLYFA